MGEQSRGELASTLSTERASNAPLPAEANVTKLASVHASVFNLFNQERSLSSRQNFKANRSSALAEWRQICTARRCLGSGKPKRVQIGLTAPLAVIADTVKGKGVSFMENKANWHHGIPNAAQFAQAMEELV